ncbi:hypothetical protein AB1Y20_015295 [Prymnesium parvum]|uniref:Uncharacterized protein n=1 Tax=Prymnesium parvum TaxID=97485 RepID=A0AB34JXD6_PRYPA|mmetsp:Transcript_47000/g.108004  ORF Transcript_47000/g.108004 Transcript_47000/m.108004 type:complete len:304 (+) Transcript_47000:41-952(+)
MCIFALALEATEDFPFVLVFNRDEFFGRPTSPVAIQDDGLLCAVDGERGGTWMGLNTRTGRFAALTNVRCQPVSGGASRGQLVRRVLHEDQSPLASAEFTSFNLLHCVLSPHGARELRLSANTPEDLGGGGAFRTTTRAVECGGGRRVLVKSNDASGKLVSDDGDGGERWPKAHWLQAEVMRVLTAHGSIPAGRAGAEALLQLLEPVMSARSLPPREAEAAATYRATWSHLSDDAEAALQRAPFIEPLMLHLTNSGGGRYGTVSQTAVFVSTSDCCVYYAYRSLHDDAAPGPWDWHKVPLRQQ